MKAVHFGKNTIVSLAVHRDWELNYRGGLEAHLKSFIWHFTRRILYRELLDVYSTKHGLEGHLLLKAHAHARPEDGTPTFYDRDRGYNLQNFVDKHDGRYLAILLFCCNEEHYELHSRASIIIHPNTCLNIVDLHNTKNLQLYMPNEGYLRTSRQLRKAIDRII